MNLSDLKEAVLTNRVLVWNDPDPIKDADYTITWIEPLDTLFDEEDDNNQISFIEDMPILIQYGQGSEAQVFLHEIKYKQ